MKRLFIAIGLLPWLAGPCLAEFEAGRAAYIDGDFSLAYQEFLPPARDGDAKSQIGLGLLHARGQGVPRNLVQAHKWFDLAATQDGANHPVIRILAKTNRNYLAKRMSTEQIAEAKIEAAKISLAYRGPAKARSNGDYAVEDTGFPVTRLRISLAYKPETEGNGHAMAKESPIEPARFESESAWTEPAKPVRIQLFAIRGNKTTKAMTEWSRLSRRHSVLAGLAPSLSRVDLGEKGVFQRLRVGPFETLADARNTCAALRAVQQGCFVIAGSR